MANDWKLATYIANLPRDRWVISVLEWYLRRVQAGRQPSAREDALMIVVGGNWEIGNLQLLTQNGGCDKQMISLMSLQSNELRNQPSHPIVSLPAL